MKTTIGVALIIVGLLGLFPPMTNANNRGFLFSEKSHDGQINTGKLLGEVLVVGFITGLVVFSVPFELWKKEPPPSKE